VYEVRKAIKTANRFETVWTTALMLPAVFVFMNAGLALYQGTGDQAQFTNAANTIATKFTGQYSPYIEKTGTGIASGIKKMAAAVSSCTGGKSSGPIYLDPTMTTSQKCSLGKSINVSSAKPYRSYY